MLTTVDFNDQPNFVTKKIDDKAPNRNLAAEFTILNFARSQHPPKTLFSVSHFPPQNPCPSVGSDGGIFFHRSPV
jgi:hypothetical protein